MEAVKQNGMALEYVELKNECSLEEILEIYLEAVKQNKWAFEFIEEKTSQICSEIIAEKDLALKEHEKPPVVIINGVRLYDFTNEYYEKIEGIRKQSEKDIEYVKEQTKKIYRVALNKIL